MTFRLVIVGLSILIVIYSVWPFVPFFFAARLGYSILAGSLALPLVWAEPVFLAETSAGATTKIPITTEAIPKMRIMVSPQCRASACRDRSYAIPCR